jgi:quercetin dioxygenase-like cupin family protein
VLDLQANDFSRFVSFFVKAGLAFAASASLLLAVNSKQPAGHEHFAFSGALPNLPGQTLTAVVVSYAPGASSPRHAHAGSVLAYVLSGAIRSQNSATGAARIYEVGEAFFEPPGSVHLVSENASSSQPATLLAIFVAPAGATLTRVEPEIEKP